MVVTPAAGRQTLQFEVCVVAYELAVVHRDPPGVVKDGAVGVDLVYRALDGVGVSVVDLAPVDHRLAFVVRVDPRLSFGGDAVVAEAGTDVAYVEEELFRVIVLHDLAYLGDKKIEIGRVEAEAVIPRRRKEVYRVVRGKAHDAVGVLKGVFLVKSGRDVDGGADAYLAAGLQLRAEKVELQPGVHDVDLCRVEGVPVMAL